VKIAAVKRLFGGTTWVAAGMALLGLAGYVYLAVLHRKLPSSDVGALTNLYLLVNIIGPGLFVTLEQETGRLVSTRLARGEGTRDTIRRMAVVGVGLLVAVLVLLGGLGPFLISREFSGHLEPYLLLLVAATGYSVVYLSRGMFSGQRRFQQYGVNVGAEGLVRLVGVVVLLLLGVASAGPYAAVLCLASVGAALATAAWLRPGEPGPVEPYGVIVRGVGWLASAWMLSQILANTGPLVVTALLPDDKTTTAAFGQTFVLARIPLFLFATLQAILLPTFSRLVAQADHAGLRRAVRSALLLVGALAVLSVAGAAVLGGFAVHLAFGYQVASWLVAGLTLSTALLMAVQVLQPAALALAAHRWVSGAWISAIVVFALCFVIPALFIPGDPVVIALVAQFAGSAAVTLVLAVALWTRLRNGADAPAEPGPPRPDPQREDTDNVDHAHL
jgi:O-antigen/teichoic acid export membrane protein